MNKEYFLLKCKLLSDLNTTTQDIIIKLNSLTLSNGEDEIVLKDKKVEYTFYSNEISNFFNLYIENEGIKDRIDYLIDEDYEITNLNLDIYSLNTKQFYEHKIVMEYGQVQVDLKNQLLASIVNSEITNESLAIIGHRPDRLYGYNLNNPKYQELAILVANKCEELILEKNIKYFITGGALGGETISFFAVEFLKKKYPNIKNILVIPFKNVFAKWQPIDIDRHKRMLSVADGVIEVDLLEDFNVPIVPKGTYNINKMSNKNDFIVDNVDYLLAIFDGKLRGNTYNIISHAKYLNREVEILEVNREDDDNISFPF